MPIKKNTKQEVEVTIPAMKIEFITISLAGDSSLICHAWSSKAKKQMLDKQMKKAETAKESKDPFRDFCDSLYWLTDKPVAPTKDDIAKAEFGFPAVAFKSAAVDACRHVSGITMAEARGAFHIVGDMVKISGAAPTMREDMVRVGMGTADLRYRGEFRKWKCKLVVRYNANVISAAQIANLFNTAGFASGVGEWRPDKSGSFGMFHVE